MLKRQLAVLLALIILSAALVLPALAQDATPTPFENRPIAGASEEVAEPETITSGGTIMLLLGIGAVVIVGGLTIARTNANRSA